MYSALIGLMMLLGAGVSAAPKKTSVERPLPWFGFGKDGGLIIVSEEREFEVPARLESIEERREFEVAAVRKWLGPKAAIVAVDTRPDKGLYLEGAPTTLRGARVGQRFEVLGATGPACTVEVQGGMRAVLRFTGQFPEVYDADEEVAVVYRGPGERVAPTRKVAEDPTVITPETLESDYEEQTPRFVGFGARVVEGTCPVDGIAAAVGQLVRAPIRVGGAVHAEAVRKDLRGNKWIVALTKDFREGAAEVGAKELGCAEGAVPEHLDQFKSGVRTRVVEPLGAPALLVAQTGSDYPCDPARAAIVYRRVGDAWVWARDLWGHAASPLRFDVIAHDARSGHTWVAGPPLRVGSDGWEWVVTALDVGGLGRSFGGWADPTAHFCNYSVTPWEFAAVCAEVVED